MKRTTCLFVLFLLADSLAFAKQGKPNVIWIQTDEQRPDSIGAYGSEWAKTPHLDALAERGVLFQNCITPSPAALFNRRLHREFAAEESIASLLEKATPPFDALAWIQIPGKKMGEKASEIILGDHPADYEPGHIKIQPTFWE